MSERKSTTHEPLFHLAKRSSIVPWKAWLIRIAAIALGLAICGFVAYLLSDKLQQGKKTLADFYYCFIKGSFTTNRKIWKFLKNMAILQCISLAVTPAFRMRFWNTGAEGQTLMGVWGAIAVAFYLGGQVPEAILLVLMLIGALICSAVWAIIPAVFKANWNTNETLFTLMMNYVAVQLVAFFVIVWEVPKGAGKIGIINQSTNAGWFPQIGGSKYLLNIIIVAILTVLMFIYMKFSKHGYEIAVVGESEPTARYVGMNVKKVVIRTMVLSGALCGVAGLLLVGGTDHTLTTTLIDGRGFTGVMVAWLAKFNPVFMILTSFLIVFLQRGSAEITTMFSLNQSYGDIITGIILFFIIGCEFFLNYQINFRKSRKEAE